MQCAALAQETDKDKLGVVAHHGRCRHADECVLFRILMEDPEIRSKVMWQDMQLVEPWENEEVSDEVFSSNPTFIPRDRLSSTQQEVSILPSFCCVCSLSPITAPPPATSQCTHDTLSSNQWAITIC